MDLSDDDSVRKGSDRKSHSSIRSSYPRPSFSRPPFVSSSSFGSSGNFYSSRPLLKGKNMMYNFLELPNFNETAYANPDSLKNFLSQLPRKSEEDLIYENRRIKLLEEQSYVKAIPPLSAEFDNMYENRRKGFSKNDCLNTHSGRSNVLLETIKDFNQPIVEAEFPKGILSVSLFLHQKIALAWMIEREKGEGVCNGGILADDQGLGKTISMISLIQMQRALQQKHMSAIKIPTAIIKTEPLNFEGEDYYYVDTAQAGTTSRLKTESFVERQVKAENVEEIPTKVSLSTCGLYREEPAGGTLVVCPASVLRQWARELDEKVMKESKISILVYHGSKRTLDPAELAKYDVVLTTYTLVTTEVQKQPIAGEGKLQSKKQKMKDEDNSGGGTLGKVRWFRVILDEAHIIKNHKTKVARACFSLNAISRWCLSGTPLQNEIDELYSYFRFLRHDPYRDYKKFVNGIKKLECGGYGHRRIGMVLKAIMLRRTKETVIDGKRILDLPPKSTYLIQVKFSDEERNFYDNLEEKCAWLFKFYVAKGSVRQNYARILTMILRLRQACDHPLLVQNAHKKVVRRESFETAMNLPNEKLLSLLRVLENNSVVCGVCFEPPELAVVSICGHVFCFECVLNHLTEKETATCPEAGCKEDIGVSAIFTEEVLKECLSDSDDIIGDFSHSSSDEEEIKISKYEPSSKIKAALQILQACCKTSIPSSPKHEFGMASSQISNPTKALVFSQWTSMLDLMEEQLHDTGLKHRRLDGTMSLIARDIAVKDFNTNPEVDIMLMSLKAGNLGLNMVAATHVILLDPWWNPTTEDQAVDRAHRIGQTRPVTVTRLTIQNTIEDRILTLQESKRKLVSSVISEDQSHGSGLSVEDFKYLFNVR